MLFNIVILIFPLILISRSDLIDSTNWKRSAYSAINEKSTTGSESNRNGNSYGSNERQMPAERIPQPMAQQQQPSQQGSQGQLFYLPGNRNLVPEPGQLNYHQNNQQQQRNRLVYPVLPLPWWMRMRLWVFGRPIILAGTSGSGYDSYSGQNQNYQNYNQNYQQSYPNQFY